MTTQSDELHTIRGPDAAAMAPSEILLAEHRVTERALNCLERMAERWAGPGRREEMDCPAIEAAINFFHTFVEAWHFRREEAYFAATGVRLESLEISPTGDCTFHDHDRCTTHLRGIEAAVKAIAACATGSRAGHFGSARAGVRSFPSQETAAAYRTFAEHAAAYTDILLKHIEHEEDFMYPVIERRLTPETKQAAVAAFRRASHDAVDPERLDECLAIVEVLADRFGVSSRRGK